MELMERVKAECEKQGTNCEEIVVPKKITTGYPTTANPDVNARMINEIIDFLEQIKERLK